MSHIPATRILPGISARAVIKKVEGNPRLPSPLYEHCRLPWRAQSMWRGQAAAASSCCLRSLGGASGIWELGEKLTKWSKADEKILRGYSVPLPVNIIGARWSLWLDHRVHNSHKCTKSYGKNKYEQRNIFWWPPYWLYNQFYKWLGNWNACL